MIVNGIITMSYNDLGGLVVARTINSMDPKSDKERELVRLLNNAADAIKRDFESNRKPKETCKSKRK